MDPTLVFLKYTGTGKENLIGQFFMRDGPMDDLGGRGLR